VKPQDLLNNTILALSTEKNSDGSECSDFEDFTHRGVLKRAKIEYGDFRSISKSELGDRDIEDEISFLNVPISFLSRGDSVIYNTVTYYIEHFAWVTKDIVNIFAKKKVRTGSII